MSARGDPWPCVKVDLGAGEAAGFAVLKDIKGATQLVLAVLDGVDIDSGTAAEIGYAFAKEGSTVNLRVEYFIWASGGDIVARVADLWRALDTIRAVVRK